MSDKDNGGPAYPAPDAARARFGETESDAFMGMTLRDYLAAKAMQGMLAYPGDEQRGSHHNNNDYDGVSSMAYAYADAMLEERAK